MATITFSQIVDKFLELCTELYVKPGRGKASDGFVPQKVEVVCDAFGHWYGHENRTSAFQDAMTKKKNQGHVRKDLVLQDPGPEEDPRVEALPSRQARLASGEGWR